MAISKTPPKSQHTNRHPRTPKNASRRSSKPPEATGPKLQQLQYRSYQHAITIYHFRARFMSPRHFRSLLRRNTHGYIDTLIGKDTLLHQFIPEGDEVPSGCIEVGYLPSVFRCNRGTQARGSALGFRREDGVIEWMCFDRCIKAPILDAWVCGEETHDLRVLEDVDMNDPRRLFDPVAGLEKGMAKKGVRGAHEEHRRWHVSLWEAEVRRVRVVWRAKQKEGERRAGLEEEKEREDEAGAGAENAGDTGIEWDNDGLDGKSKAQELVRAEQDVAGKVHDRLKAF